MLSPSELLDAFTPTHLGVQNNRWLCWHVLMAAVYARILRRAGVRPRAIITSVIIIAIAFEVGQTIWQVTDGGLLSHNASYTHWWWDSFFDIVFPTVIAQLVV